MSTKVVERPAVVSFSKNELRYQFFTDNLSPENLFIQVQLYTRPGKTNTFLNWILDEQQSPLIDNNLLIKVNGKAVVNARFAGSGTLNLKDGDHVEISQNKFTAWPATDPYAKIVVLDGSTEISNTYTTDGTIGLSFDTDFYVVANKTYTVFCYTRNHSSVPYSSTLSAPAVNTFTKLKTFNLKPNTDGNSYLYLDGWIDSLLKWVAPELGNPFTNAAQQTAEFYILFREVSAADLDPAWISTEADHKRIALKGGIEKQKSSRNNFFLYQAIKKSFFTWIPSGRFIYADQHNFLSVFIATPATYSLVITCTKTDGTTATAVIPLALNASRFYHLNVGYAALDINTIAGGALVHFYEVSLKDATDTIIYAPAKFYLEYRPLYENFELIYHNSQGGIDTTKVKGDTLISIEKEVVEMDGGMSITGWSDLIKVGESSQSVTKKDTYKGNIGFVHSKAHQEALQDLLISPSIYQYLDGRLVMVLNIQKSIDLRKTTDRIYSLAIEWQLPFSNEVFTPKLIDLGMGTDTETY